MFFLSKIGEKSRIGSKIKIKIKSKTGDKINTLEKGKPGPFKDRAV